MAKTWQDFIDGLKDEIGILAKEELKELIDGAKKDRDAFIKRQGEKLELYLQQLAEKKITKRQFKGYILDIIDLTRIQARKMKVRAKARAQKLAKRIKRLIIDSLFELL